jgi:hypothetical protein
MFTTEYRATISTPSYIFLLNDFSGVRKLAIAKSTSSFLANTSTPHPLLNNYLIIDAAHSTIPDRSPSDYFLRK